MFNKFVGTGNIDGELHRLSGFLLLERDEEIRLLSNDDLLFCSADLVCGRSSSELVGSPIVP